LILIHLVADGNTSHRLVHIVAVVVFCCLKVNPMIDCWMFEKIWREDVSGIRVRQAGGEEVDKVPLAEYDIGDIKRVTGHVERFILATTINCDGHGGTEIAVKYVAKAWSHFLLGFFKFVYMVDLKIGRLVGNGRHPESTAEEFGVYGADDEATVVHFPLLRNLDTTRRHGRLVNMLDLDTRHGEKKERKMIMKNGLFVREKI
jgi:hypothetical protein